MGRILNLDHKVTDWFKVSAKEMLSFTNTSGFRDQVQETCMTVQFSHIMAGGYAAGYYSYKDESMF